LSKRILDLCFATLGLLLTAPLWVVIPLLIWLEAGRPVLLSQERVGKEGRVFRLLKFRTMWRNAEAVGVIEDREQDPRVTRVGRLLRATALDELPQLLNILKGEMSVVGPRALPLRIEDRESTRYRTIRDIEGYTLRSSVKPGLTGIAQIFAPKDIPRRSKFRYDLLYIKRWSFCLDLKLIVLSVWITLRGRWELRGRKL
jgi:lipopolysaccharide/colanic/teichoic acid biosynthesis glycosyltransferase